MQPTLMILAAGLGSRYGSLKQMDKIGPSGETLIQYSIFDAARTGFGKVVFVIRKETEAEFKEVMANRIPETMKVEYAFQELDALPSGYKIPEGRVKPWGTGHAILVARDKIQEPFAVINADDFYGRDSFQLLSDFLMSKEVETGKIYGMVGYQLRKTLSEFGTVSRGVCRTDSDFYLQDIEEKTKILKEGENIYNQLQDGSKEKIDGNCLVSMNCWGFAPSIFHYLEKHFLEFLKQNYENNKAEFYIPFVVNGLIQAKEVKVKVLHGKAEWFGMTYKEDRALAVEKIKELIIKGDYPVKL